MRLTIVHRDAQRRLIARGREERIGLAYRRDWGPDDASGFTGRLFWNTTGNGFTVPQIGDSARYDLAVDALFAEATTQLPATVRAMTTLDGAPVAIIRVGMNGAFPIDIYEDTSTGAYRQAVIDPGGSNETTIAIRSYITARSGRKIIGSWSYGSAADFYA